MTRVPVAQRRQELIEAAVEVIALHGIDGATTRRIAEQAQANVAMLHYCYDSKEDLFADVFAHVADRFRKVIEASGPHTEVADTARQLLRGVMNCYFESATFAAAAFELINWARRQHGSGGIAVYEQALEAARTALRDSSSDRPIAAETIQKIVGVITMLSDGFAASWLTYGDRDSANEQMELAESVLDSWLRTHLDSPAGVL